MVDVAERFILFAVQENGQPKTKRLAAIQEVLDAAGWDAKAEGLLVFGGLLTTPCSGPDGEAATDWLMEVCSTMERGHFEDEVAHVQQAIEERSGR